ncbi:hypothetical protein N665_0085s0005 [Sinapis alba]|nr:hypothetical protein N665_0085s0005 [Sinapis alba]
MDSRWSLQGMTALVTGGTKWIGYTIVEELAGFGASVHTCARDQTLLDECLSECEWASDGIRANSVAPWVTKTPLVQKRLDDKKYAEAIFSRTPLGRACEPPSYITGQTICIDGGFTVNGFSYKPEV